MTVVTPRGMPILATVAGLAVLGWLIFGWLVPGFRPPEGERAGVAPSAAVVITLEPPGAAASLPAGEPASVAVAVKPPPPLVGNATLADPAWAARAAQTSDIPVRALLGYAGASLALAAEQPNCRLGWTTLAALGNIESGHGTHNGSGLGADGAARPGIFGPALDGNAFDAMGDTDRGAWDGSTEGDRAVGPLQFIPATWQRWGADGNGDGVDDPQQIDDAALAAGRYLCHYGELSRPDRWRAAVFAYNHVDSYVNAVAATADSYADLAG
ncbi:lytic transglycosylase domain-containing protein [Cryobacterium sinapicolor]|uniref:lytic transglycosylase domain-containing protein n=1 Tax=Cryobacterium sinapicolor TaxID=1259236 RepID=UPI001F53E4AF|nr:lytic transglycosylase domain-containing protein [Cryobacterium sinapicolor]